jgi:hypothetical protein
MYDDRNQQQLYVLDKLVGLPEFVKQSQMDSELVAKLPGGAFADPVHRKFPCHTKAATWLANAYFQQCLPSYKAEEARQVQARLEKWAEYWQASGDLRDFNAKWAAVNSPKAASLTDADFALVATADGVKYRRMPMPTPLAVKAAGDYLYTNRFNYTYPMRKEAAQHILRKAAEFTTAGQEAPDWDTHVSDYLMKAAGAGTTHPQWAANKVGLRLLMLGQLRSDDELRVKVAEAVTALADMEQPDAALFDKMATAIDALDRVTGLHKHYADGVDLPEEIFFEVLEKDAESAITQFVRLTTGSVYSLDQLLTMPLDKIASVLGPDFLSSVQDSAGTFDVPKFIEALPTLPRPDAALIEHAMGHSKMAMEVSAWDKDKIKEFFRKRGDKTCEDYRMYVALEHPQKARTLEELAAGKD